MKNRSKTLLKDLGNNPISSFDINNYTPILISDLYFNDCPLSYFNFNDINNNHESLITLYSELNKKIFFELIDQLHITSTNVLNILNSVSKSFTNENKLDIIKTIDEDLIIRDKNLQSCVCKFLLSQVNIPISDNLINSLLSSNNLVKTRVSLFNKYYSHSLSLSRVNERLISLGTPFNNLIDSLDTIDLLDTQENNDLYSNLKGRILGSKKEKNGKLKIWQLKNKR